VFSRMGATCLWSFDASWNRDAPDFQVLRFETFTDECKDYIIFYMLTQSKKSANSYCRDSILQKQVLIIIVMHRCEDNLLLATQLLQ
jgi:hypothetical protein